MTAPDAPLEEGSHTLADGRALRWARWGVAGGEPVLLFHGNPGSRLLRLHPEALAAAGVELVTVDRPGVGGSTPRPGRRMVDWAGDVAELTGALGVARFGVIGVSMGGPHALACGAAMPGRVVAAAVHASPGPWSEDGFEALAPPQILEMRHAFAADAVEAEPRFREAIAEQRRAMLDRPVEALRAFLSRLGAPDRKLLDDAWARAMTLEDAGEALRQGVEGFFEERMAGYVLDWGFRLAEVRVPVTVFHGTQDAWVPPAVGRELARRLPRATLRELPGAGHFPRPDAHGDLLRAATGAAAAPR